MTILINADGVPLGWHGKPEDAVEHAFNLAVIGQPTVIILPGGRCWWMDRTDYGLWKLKGSDYAA